MKNHRIGMAGCMAPEKHRNGEKKNQGEKRTRFIRLNNDFFFLVRLTRKLFNFNHRRFVPVYGLFKIVKYAIKILSCSDFIFFSYRRINNQFRIFLSICRRMREVKRRRRECRKNFPEAINSIRVKTLCPLFN